MSDLGNIVEKLNALKEKLDKLVDLWRKTETGYTSSIAAIEDQLDELGDAAMVTGLSYSINGLNDQCLETQTKYLATIADMRCKLDGIQDAALGKYEEADMLELTEQIDNFDDMCQRTWAHYAAAIADMKGQLKAAANEAARPASLRG